MSNNEPKILVNRIRLPSGKYLESRYRWDYRVAEGFFIDGGQDYVRTNMLDESNICTVYDTDSVEVIRDALRWGTVGKNLGKKPQRVKIKDLSNLHVQAIIDWTEKRADIYHDVIPEVFKRELQYRKENDIDIPDTDDYNVDYGDEYYD